MSTEAFFVNRCEVLPLPRQGPGNSAHMAFVDKISGEGRASAVANLVEWARSKPIPHPLPNISSITSPETQLPNSQSREYDLRLSQLKVAKLFYHLL
jgi:hypothetical protein